MPALGAANVEVLAVGAEAQRSVGGLGVFDHLGFSSGHRVEDRAGVAPGRDEGAIRRDRETKGSEPAGHPDQSALDENPRHGLLMALCELNVSEHPSVQAAVPHPVGGSEKPTKPVVGKLSHPYTDP